MLVSGIQLIVVTGKTYFPQIHVLLLSAKLFLKALLSVMASVLGVLQFCTLSRDAAVRYPDLLCQEDVCSCLTVTFTSPMTQDKPQQNVWLKYYVARTQLIY